MKRDSINIDLMDKLANTNLDNGEASPTLDEKGKTQKAFEVNSIMSSTASNRNRDFNYTSIDFANARTNAKSIIYKSLKFATNNLSPLDQPISTKGYQANSPTYKHFPKKPIKKNKNLSPIYEKGRRLRNYVDKFL